MGTREWYVNGMLMDVGAPFTQLERTDEQIKSRAMIPEGEYKMKQS